MPSHAFDAPHGEPQCVAPTLAHRSVSESAAVDAENPSPRKSELWLGNPSHDSIQPTTAALSRADGTGPSGSDRFGLECRRGSFEEYKHPRHTRIRAGVSEAKEAKPRLRFQMSFHLTTAWPRPIAHPHQLPTPVTRMKRHDPLAGMQDS
jgi:hypothetical protein